MKQDFFTIKIKYQLHDVTFMLMIGYVNIYSNLLTAYPFRFDITNYGISRGIFCYFYHIRPTRFFRN